ncbi:MAG: histidine kinase, partial [Prolixibacteraceae bacterium]|nr:histidine kinase [Prolixibacteraceae bacterium]
LFGSVKWSDYQSFSSMDMMRFISDYLDIKSIIIAGLKEYHPTSETGKYHLAKLIFNNKIEYHARSQCVYEALKRKDLEEGRVLFNDYEKTYKGTGFYPFLKSKLENRVELGEGATAPEFIATDVNGKKITLGKLKGKYVQLLFVDLKYEDDKQELAEYQKLKELSAKKFELITVFINENDSLTKAYIKEDKPKGILISNPDWQLENLKTFNSEYTSPYYLVNPEGIIVFSGAGSPTEEFVQMIIEMINNDTYNQAEASVSKRTLYWVLLLSVLTILTAFGVFVVITKSVKRRETFRRNQLELKLSAVRSQLNPHFLFNSMTSIQYLVNHNENEKANLFLSKFAQLMRKVLFQSEIERIPLKEELATIETYLELEALRHRFLYKINVEENIDLHNTEIPVMLLQPFVENAVIHGISKLGEKGTIEINVKKSGTHQLKISIIDNGSGYTNGTKENANSNGKGMQITRKRIDLMMAKYGHEIDFKVMNRKEIDASLTGTEVEITFETEA